MQPLPFSLRQLQYALAVAELGGFRKAADACHVSQPSLSAQVKALEEALGVPLFERSASVRVTAAGAALLARMRDVQRASEDVLRAARALHDPFHGEMRIGVIPTVASYALPSFTPALRKAHPALTVLWVEEKTSALVARLEAGELDAAVLALEADIGALAHERIAEDPFVLAGAPGHPLLEARRPLRGLDVLEGETIHLLDEGHCFRDQAKDLCSRVGLREAAFRATSLATLVQVVLGTGGLTLLPTLALPVENRGRGLAVRSFAKPSPARTLALAFRATSPASEALRALAQILRRAYPKHGA